MDHTMCTVGHSGQTCHCFSLTACRDNDGLFLRIIIQLCRINDRVIGDPDITHFRCNPDDIDHTASLDDNLASELMRNIDDLLYTVHIRSKGRDDQACVLVLGENANQCIADCFL